MLRYLGLERAAVLDGPRVAIHTGALVALGLGLVWLASMPSLMAILAASFVVGASSLLVAARA